MSLAEFSQFGGARFVREFLDRFIIGFDRGALASQEAVADVDTFFVGFL